MARSSLTLRLVAASGIGIAGALIVAGMLLVALFRDHIERRFDAMLSDHMEELAAAGDITPAGNLALSWVPFDPRFNRPLSGWYWQIGRQGKIVAQSDSTWRTELDVAPPPADAPPATQNFTGPGGRRLRAIVQQITFPRSAEPFTFVVAGPAANIESDVREFASKLAITLGLLGAGLIAAVWLQVRFGLRPLRRLRASLSDVRAGRRKRLPETFPEEVQPVVSELNALLDHTAAWLDRARTQTGNLAHALKNPLTVIRNEAGHVEGERGQILREQAATMTQWIERFLSRSRAAGSMTALGARTAVAEVAEDLRFSMSRLYGERALAIELADVDGLYFRGDAQDLEEMLGNLMDNACKWARTRVRVSGRLVDRRLSIRVEDDGPGVPDALASAAVRRGSRLDERVPGSGLGLDIVRDIAELNGGSIHLEESALGGLCARIDLPAAV